MGSAAHRRDIDMLVVSNGVTGMTMALALATYGMRVHVVSRSGWLDASPDPQLIDRRSMAIFRALDVADDVIAVANRWPQLGGTVFAGSLGAQAIMRIDATGAAGHDSPIDIAQATLTNALLGKAVARGATVAFNGEYLGHQQDEDGVTVTLHDLVLDRIYTVRAGYVFGADGYRSRGGEEGCALVARGTAPLATIEARFTADLAPRLGDRPSVFNWIVAPDAAAGRRGTGLLRAVSPWREWIARWDVDASAGAVAPDRDAVRTCIATMIDGDAGSVELGAVKVQPVSHRLAKARGKGRVFCGGDVIRYLTHPGGPGTNSGIQDAYELAAKLALVAQGEAGPGLLDSYALDGAPVEPRLTLVASGETPLQHFLTGPSGSKEIAAALRAEEPAPHGSDRGRVPAARAPAPRTKTTPQIAQSPRARHHAGH